MQRVITNSSLWHALSQVWNRQINHGRFWSIILRNKSFLVNFRPRLQVGTIMGQSERSSAAGSNWTVKTIESGWSRLRLDVDFYSSTLAQNTSNIIPECESCSKTSTVVRLPCLFVVHFGPRTGSPTDFLVAVFKWISVTKVCFWTQIVRNQFAILWRHEVNQMNN